MLIPHAQTPTSLSWHVTLYSEEMSQHALNHMRGISNPDRIDEALYHDFESDAARVVGFRVGLEVWAT